MLRNMLMTCHCIPQVVDVVQGNKPVLCLVYIGDRKSPSIRFSLEDIDGHELNDIQVYLSTENREPSENSNESYFVNVSKFKFCCHHHHEEGGHDHKKG
jgi:hypothetical protein